jgi:hypothetical protein
MAMEDFPVLLAPSNRMLPLEVFDRKCLVEYPSREIYGYLKLKDGFLPMA